MTWGTETPPLVGSVWHLREPDDSDAYATVRIVGTFDATTALEVVVAPYPDFGEPVSLDVDEFASAYTQHEPDESAAALRARVERLR